MWRWWPSSWAPAPEPPGAALQVAAIGVVVAAAVGNLIPPERGWAGIVVGLALVTAVVALRAGSLVLWGGVGLLAGAAACALAPHRQGLEVVPVRFVVSVRDGWTAGPRGWSTRVRVGTIEGAGGVVRTASELTMTLGGAVQAAELPAPGARCEGAGELLFNRDRALRSPLLRVKTRLLLRDWPAAWWSVDALRERLAVALRREAGRSPRRQAGAALAAALVLGRQEALDRQEVAVLRRSGLAHILSVSGLHVVLVSSLLWGLMTLLGLAPRTRRWLLIPSLIVFAMVAGGSAPVLRATTATVGYLVTRLAGRPMVPLAAMWAVVAGLVLVEPAALLQPGFQLSAGVSLALIRWVGPVVEGLEVLPRWLAAALGVAVVGQLASWPLVGAAFSVVPPLGAAVNLLAAPLALPLVALSLLATVLVMLGAGVAGPVLWLTGLGNLALVRISEWGGGTSWLFAPPPGWLAAAAVALLLIGLVVSRRAWLPALLLVTGSVAWTLLPAPGRRPAGELDLLAVSEGMALLVRGGGAAVLVDGGRGPNEALRGLAAARVRRLAAVLLTHGDADHTGGLAAVLERARVGELVVPVAVADRPELAALLALAARRDVVVRRVGPGDRLAWGGMTAEVAWPPRQGVLTDNDLSLVTVLEVGGQRLLVTGDLEQGGEAALVATGANLRAAMLQLPHHGSRTSSSPALLAACRPRVAIAATGARPRFPYPDPRVQARVRALPSVMVAQTAGIARLWWDESAVWIGTSEPVRVFTGSRQ